MLSLLASPMFVSVEGEWQKQPNGATVCSRSLHSEMLLLIRTNDLAVTMVMDVSFSAWQRIV